MKRILVLLLIVFLVACSNDNDLDENEIKLAEDKNVKIIVEVVEKEIEGKDRRVIEFIELINKTDRTFKVDLTSFVLDGDEVYDFNLFEFPDELRANEAEEIMVFTFIEEHLKGSIGYEDYEGNKHTIQFNEYIN